MFTVLGKALTKILLLNVDPNRMLAVPMYLELLMQNLDGNRYHTEYFIQSRAHTFWNKILFPFIVVTRLFWYISTLLTYKPDVVHINPSLRSRAMLRDSVYLFISRALGYKVVFFIHGWDPNLSSHFSRYNFLGILFYGVFSIPNRIIVLSQRYKKELIELGISPSKITVLPTMVDAKKFHPNNKKFRRPFEVLFCAAMIKQKGAYELLMAIPFVLKQFGDTVFTFMGIGVELDNLKHLSRKLKVEHSIRFVGFKTGEEKTNIFKSAHILVLPSYSEGFPLVVLEGMASGQVIVATAVGGLRSALRDYVHGSIIVSNPPNAKEIAEKIVELLEKPLMMRKISINNLGEVERRYDANIVSRNVEKIYTDVVRS